MTVLLRRLTAALVLIAVAVLGIVLVRDHLPPGTVQTPALVCPAHPPKRIGTVLVPRGPVAGFCQDRLVNAAHIINAARALGIGEHTQAIGVMTAIGESGLVNLDHGDTAGPDSRGLFQQRANGAWGSLQDRMTPYTAAYHFFAALVAIPSWKRLTPTEAAHAVQANADPGYYGTYWDDAVTIVTALNGKAPAHA